MTNYAFYTPLSLGTEAIDELQLQGTEPMFGLQEIGVVHSYPKKKKTKNHTLCLK